MIRYPSVAGMFYPGDRKSLSCQLKSFIQDPGEKLRVKGLISPHAGYDYSGGCAGKGFSRVVIPDRIIILGVNHRGVGHPMAVDGNDKWNSPLGDIEIDDILRDELVMDSEVFRMDSDASAEEHSLEVQVPFIQFLNSSARILPITVGTHNRDMLHMGGIEIADMIKRSGEDVLIIASTDMSHYISSDDAKDLDSKAIEKIEGLDPDGLFDTVYTNRISMCGLSPTYIMMIAAKRLGGTKGVVIDYTNSGYTSGDFDQVVGYLSAYID